MLINKIEDYKEYLRVANHLKFEALQPHFKTVQASTIVKYFGAAFITVIDTRYNATTPTPALTAEENYLIDLLQKAIASLGMVKALPTMMVNVQGSGVEQAGSKPLFEWQKLDLENELLETGYTAIGNAIDYLFLNRDNTRFALWKDSDCEKAARKCLFNSVNDFNDCVQIANSTRTFESLKQSIKEALVKHIKPTVTADLLTEITNENIDFSIEGTKLEALQLIRDALAQFSMAIAIYKLELKFNEEGARVISVSSTSGKAKVKTPADLETKARLADMFISTGEMYLQELQEFLLANNLSTPTTYEEIDNSTGVVHL